MIRHNKRAFLKSLGALVLGAFLPKAATASATSAAPHHLVVLGDMHLPGNNLALKAQVLQTINSWRDVEAVVAVGDLCEGDGSAAEYAAIKSFFEPLAKPLLPVVGNHDFIYSRFQKGTKSVRRGSTLHPDFRPFSESAFSAGAGLKAMIAKVLWWHVCNSRLQT